jgi:sec-independent protein translocase protein TatA
LVFSAEEAKMPNIGPLEIVLVLIIVLIIFGPKRLPEMGRSLGRGIREFKNSVTGHDEEDEPPRIERPTTTDETARPLEGEVVHDRKP